MDKGNKFPFASSSINAMNAIGISQSSDKNDHTNSNDITAATRTFTYNGKQCLTNRLTRIAAIDFLSDNEKGFINKRMDWKSLPKRLNQLCDSIENWERHYENADSFDDKDDLIYDSSFFNSHNDAEKSARISAMTASVMVLAPNSFPKAFQSLFLASLDYRDSITDTIYGEDMIHAEKMHEYLEALSFDNVNDHIDTNPAVEYAQMEQKLFANLRITGWIVRRNRGLLFNQLFQAIYDTVLRKVTTIIEADDEYSPNLYSERVCEWKERVIEQWLIDLLHGEDLVGIKKPLSEVSLTWKRQVDLLVSETYLSVRMEQLFSIITDYPESHATVLELKHILENSENQHSELATNLRSSLVRRLNHPGATTTQIIEVYIATIKVLRLIDPSDRLLSIVAEPVRTYLRRRNDTVRCIITSLTDADVGGDLYQELRRQDAKPLENVTVDSDDEEEPPDLHHWQPSPSINKTKGAFFQPSSSGGRHHSSSHNNDDVDILAMLVSIYGSKELFVDEYRLMLADKLLASLDYNTDKEVHTLELLKLRFGELSMRNCEVMIKDMDDSKRANTLIHSSLETNVSSARRQNLETNTDKCAVDAVMISHIFWPTLQNKETLKHHPRIQAELDEFSDMYAKLKNPRKLDWMSQLGTVQLELDVYEEVIDNTTTPHVVTKEFSCSPIQATLISHFEDNPVWTAEELSNETGIPEQMIQRKMAFWVSNRVLVVSRSGTTMVYKLSSRADHQFDHGKANHDMVMLMDDDNDDSNNAVSASNQEQQEMEIYESFITAMLTNTGQSTLERIHNMLKMFVSAGSETKYNKTPQQLNAFLQYLCQQEKLECGPDNMYKLFKKE